MRSVYIAAPIGQAGPARRWAAILQVRGFRITSLWHDLVANDAVDPVDPTIRTDVLFANLADIAASDAVLALTRDGRPKATYSEIGYAIALGKRVVWLSGGESNIFDAHPLSRVVDDDGVVEALL